MWRPAPPSCSSARSRHAGWPDPGCVAPPGLAHDVGQPVRDVVAGSRQARKLAVLDPHRLGTGFSVRDSGSVFRCAIVCGLPGRFRRRIHEMVEDLSDPLARELMLAEALAHVPGYRPGGP